MLELLLGLTEPHRQSDQLGLGAVVQVAFDASEGLGGGVEGLRPRLLEAPHPGRRRVGAEQEVHHPPVEVDDQPHRPRGDEEQDDPGHEDTPTWVTNPGAGPAVVGGADEPGEGAEPRRGRCHRSRGEAMPEERLDPDAEREPHAEDGERHLGHEVARPPARRPGHRATPATTRRTPGGR